MKSPFAAAALISWLLLLPAAFGDSASDWQALQSALRPSTVVTTTNPSNAAQISTQQVEINRLNGASQSAKKFYSAYPNDPHAAEARKLEITTLLQAGQLGDAAAETAVMALGKAYRADTTVAVKDRFDVALGLQALASNHTVGTPAASEASADALHTEFGDIPEVFALYLSIARTADSTSAQRVAQKLQSFNAPGPMKSEAAKTLGRAALIGQSIDLTKQIPGFKNSDLHGGITVIYLWNANSGYGDLDLLTAFKGSIPNTVHVVYIGLGGSAASVPLATTHEPFNGSQYFDSNSLASGVASTLNLQQLPYVYVLKPDGTLCGFGPVQSLVNLVAAAGR